MVRRGELQFSGRHPGCFRPFLAKHHQPLSTRNSLLEPSRSTGCRIHSLHNRSSLAHSPHHSTSTPSGPRSTPSCTPSAPRPGHQGRPCIAAERPSEDPSSSPQCSLLNCSLSKWKYCEGKEKTGASYNERRLMMIIVSLKKCVAGTDLSNQNEKECKMEIFSDTDDICNGD